MTEFILYFGIGFLVILGLFILFLHFYSKKTNYQDEIEKNNEFIEQKIKNQQDTVNQQLSLFNSDYIEMMEIQNKIISKLNSMDEKWNQHEEILNDIFELMEKKNKKVEESKDDLDKNNDDNNRPSKVDKEYDESLSLEESMEKINKLIGLKQLKDEINLFITVLNVNSIRESLGKKPIKQSLHSLFLGPPGTGKTTVARILGNIYRSTGILEKGHVVEVTRSDLVAEYIGKSAILTNQKINEALGGILFVDEAYSLFSDSKNDFGNEVISTLIKRMEDERDDFVVIFAGYEKEMKSLLDSNTGLRSRFTHSFHFETYSKDELLEIFKSNFTDQGFYLTEKAEQKLIKLFQEELDKNSEHFGNGRFARNMFNRAIRNQSERIYKISKERDVTIDDLEKITEEDIENV